MELKDIAHGNLFKFFPIPGRAGQIAFKTNEVIIGNSSTIIPLGVIYQANINMLVYPICNVEEFNSTKRPSWEIIKILDIESSLRENGVVIWTGNPLGLLQNLVVFDNIDESRVLVADLGTPIILDDDSRVADLGTVGKYKESTSNIIKICPNCTQKSLIIDKDNPEGYVCLSCGIKIILSWS
jgi:hypothetical protein